MNLITARDVAELLGCDYSTVWRKVREDKLPKPIRVAGLVRWRRADIDAIIETASAESEAA